MDLDFALVRFSGGATAAETFAAARDRSGADATWTREVGLVEHHHDGHMVLRGTFAGHYVDADEALHVSERGVGEGFAVGALVGVLGGPPGLAIGMVLGATLGSQVGAPSEADFEPEPLVDRLRMAVPNSGSAIVLIAPPRDVAEMLTAIGESGGEVVRGTLTADQAAALQASISATPPASPGPSKTGEASREASEPQSS
jgi:uncharacterized membrane protein